MLSLADLVGLRPERGHAFRWEDKSRPYYDRKERNAIGCLFHLT